MLILQGYFTQGELQVGCSGDQWLMPGIGMGRCQWQAGDNRQHQLANGSFEFEQARRLFR